MRKFGLVGRHWNPKPTLGGGVLMGSTRHLPPPKKPTNGLSFILVYLFVCFCSSQDTVRFWPGRLSGTTHPVTRSQMGGGVVEPPPRQHRPRVRGCTARPAHPSRSRPSGRSPASCPSCHGGRGSDLCPASHSTAPPRFDRGQHTTNTNRNSAIAHNCYNTMR